ncbi:glutamine synthetase family protein [Siminovitchia fortis]|uniref:glutamine synthetase family protein n=1 Tax=Siminovitchia fortis TaxID=254758 RepID=UPI001FD1D297|nr:glutamine synthetase family protein [Siminovitchia fortis]
MVTTKEQVKKMIEKNHIEFLDIGYMDYAALSRIRTVRVEELDSLFDQGLNFFAGMMSFNAFDEYIPNPMYGIGEGDFFAIPDPSTFAILPHRQNTARMFCDLVDENGEPWKGCPRQALKRVLKEAEAELGGIINLAFEQEAYLLNEVGGTLVTADTTHCFSIEGIQMQEKFLHDFVKAMEKAGVKVEKISSEYGPGQFEINLKHASAVRAADEQVLFMQLFKQIALQHGLVGTLMPKPFQDLSGSGLHVHISMFNGKGKNVFEDHSDQLGLTEQASHFVGGLLKHARSLVAIGAPSINSYKRMYPGSFAPAQVCYGIGNRSTLIRITEKRRGSRFEFRGADGTCNPYLLAAALVAAGLDGVREKIDPGEPLSSDAGVLSEVEMKRRGIEWIPGTLDEAITELEGNEKLGDLIGRQIWEEFIKVKRTEVEKAARYVTDWERMELSRRF